MHRAPTPLKRTKITHPPAPWLNTEGIRDLQINRDVVRREAHLLKSLEASGAFREVSNLLRTKIKQARKSFIDKALSSTRPKEIWRPIHRILDPSPQPQRLDAVNELNNCFFEENLINLVHSLHSTTGHDPLKLRACSCWSVKIEQGDKFIESRTIFNEGKYLKLSERAFHYHSTFRHYRWRSARGEAWDLTLMILADLPKLLTQSGTKLS